MGLARRRFASASTEGGPHEGIFTFRIRSEAVVIEMNKWAIIILCFGDPVRSPRKCSSELKHRGNSLRVTPSRMDFLAQIHHGGRFRCEPQSRRFHWTPGGKAYHRRALLRLRICSGMSVIGGSYLQELATIILRLQLLQRV